VKQATSKLKLFMKTFINVLVYEKYSLPFLFLYASRDRRGFGNLMFLLWFALLGGFFLSSSMWVLPFCSLYSPFFFFGALVYLWLAGSHHQHLLFHIHFGWNWNPNNYVQIDWIGCDYHLSKINSYYKMIIWFFCCKILPFLEIVLQKSLEKPVF